jgi:hypothetical protein
LVSGVWGRLGISLPGLTRGRSLFNVSLKESILSRAAKIIGPTLFSAIHLAEAKTAEVSTANVEIPNTAAPTAGFGAWACEAKSRPYLMTSSVGRASFTMRPTFKAFKARPS